MNDSSTGGYILPLSSSPPLEDAALDAVFQQLVVGLTGLPGNMVRPRWQPTVPKQPEPTENWCAIGLTEDDPDDYPAVIHKSSGNGQDNFYQHETLNVLASFYGPNSMGYAKLARNGLYIAQNREALMGAGFDVLEAKKITAAPELINQQWVKRYDLNLRLRRQVVRAYTVLNILSADGTLEADSVTTDIVVQQ
jgi:hypothetical protein